MSNSVFFFSISLIPCTVRMLDNLPSSNIQEVSLRVKSVSFLVEELYSFNYRGQI